MANNLRDMQLGSLGSAVAAQQANIIGANGQDHARDTMIAHVSPGEIVLPPMATLPNELVEMLKGTIRDLSKRTVGHPSTKKNPLSGFDAFTPGNDVTVPRSFGEGEHFVELAFITPKEQKLLMAADLHDSKPPHRGPSGVPNFNSGGSDPGGDDGGDSGGGDEGEDPVGGGADPMGGGETSGNPGDPGAADGSAADVGGFETELSDISNAIADVVAEAASADPATVDVAGFETELAEINQSINETFSGLMGLGTDDAPASPQDPFGGFAQELAEISEAIGQTEQEPSAPALTPPPEIPSLPTINISLPPPPEAPSLPASQPEAQPATPDQPSAPTEPSLPSEFEEQSFFGKVLDKVNVLGLIGLGLPVPGAMPALQALGDLIGAPSVSSAFGSLSEAVSEFGTADPGLPDVGDAPSGLDPFGGFEGELGSISDALGGTETGTGGGNEGEPGDVGGADPTGGPAGSADTPVNDPPDGGPQPVTPADPVDPAEPGNGPIDQIVASLFGPGGFEFFDLPSRSGDVHAAQVAFGFSQLGRAAQERERSV